MARPLASSAVLSLLFLACATPEGDSPASGRAAGRTLFDGRTLAGWEGDPRFWRVEDGALVGESSAANPCEATSYLACTAGEFADFELTLRYRIHAGNSGVQFRSRVAGFERVSGYQADLEAGPDWTGGLYEQDGRGVVTRRGERVVLDVQGNRTVERFADADALLARVPAGEWHTLVLTAHGPRLAIAIDGELYSETIDLDPAHAAASGRIALQLHAGPPMKVEFRDLFVRALPAPAPGEAAGQASAPAARSPWSVEGDPLWLWPTAEAQGGEAAWFRRTFELPERPRAAELWIVCDNRFEAWLGGTSVAQGDDWFKPRRYDVTDALRAGTNELVVRGENEGGPAALALRLEVEHEAGARVVIESDGDFASWSEPAGKPLALAEALAQARWSAPHVHGGLDTAPWTMAAGATPAAPGIAPEGSAITVPAGFAVERIYSVPMDTAGSWVSLAIDPRGRLYASDQYGGLFRVTLRAGAEPEVEPIDVPLGEAHGLLWAHDSLYVVVNHGGEFESGLWRVRDTDGDDRLDSAQLLRAIAGDGEHGPHAVVLDADGEHLVVVGGNHTKLPGPIDRSRLPANGREDHLLPLIPDPGGHAVGVWAPGGWIVRTDREGRQWELIAAGFRNAYDVAFDRAGELFTYDSDMEWDVGMPWYRPTRVCHVVSGAEFGWRNGSSKWPADSFDSLPAAVDLGLGSPTGVVFGTRTNFPSPWREALFACDWAYGRIFAVHLTPQGASYTGTSEIFASGQPFPVTDLEVGPDGALYVTIGGRQAQSGLYRITWTGAPAERRSEWTRDLVPVGLRRELERDHGLATSGRVELALRELASEDPFVRNAARILLEAQPVAGWAPQAAEFAADRPWLEGALARVRCAAVADVPALLARAAALAVGGSGPELRLDATRLIEVALLRLTPGDSERATLRATLDPAYPSGDARLDRALLGLLVYLEADVAGRALEALERASTQEERIAILYALRAHAGPWTSEHGARALALMARERETAQGGASVRGYLDAMMEQLESHVGASAPGAAAPVTAAAPGGGGQPAHAWTLAELEPHLSKLDLGRDFANGERAFRAATCLDCHRFHGQGQNQGPDLSGVGGRYSGRDFLRAILEPSREVPDVWRDTEFWAGEKLLAVGRLEAETESEVVVRDAQGQSHAFARDEVSERRLHALSRMPASLLDTFTLEDILDLAAYALASGNPANERFTR